MPDELPDSDFDADLDDSLDPNAEGSGSSDGQGGGLLSAKGLICMGLAVALGAGLSALCVSLVAAEPSSPQTGESSGTDAPKTPKSRDEGKGIIYPVDDIVVNLVGDRARRYLKTAVRLELASEDVSNMLNRDYYKVKLRDALITLLSSKTLDDIEHPDSKSRLRREIRDELNLMFELNQGVVQVYFTDFMVQ